MSYRLKWTLIYVCLLVAICVPAYIYLGARSPLDFVVAVAAAVVGFYSGVMGILYWLVGIGILIYIAVAVVEKLQRD